jgi:ribosomal protein L24E
MYIFVLPEGFTILWFCSKTTWKCTIENEIKERGYTWGTIERKANNREELRKLVLVLCAMRYSKDNNREEWRKLVLVLCVMRHSKD